jgi:hypothetical protein
MRSSTRCRRIGMLTYIIEYSFGDTHAASHTMCSGLEESHVLKSTMDLLTDPGFSLRRRATMPWSSMIFALRASIACSR